MTRSRDLTARVTFSERATASDGFGNTVGTWVDRTTVWAGLTYLRGTEAVMASRLEGRQPVVVRVRRSAATLQVGTDWRIRDDGTGTIFNIRTIVPTPDRRFLDITAESGGAT